MLGSCLHELSAADADRGAERRILLGDTKAEDESFKKRED